MIHGQSLPVWATQLPKTWTARRLKYDATFNDDKLPEDFPEDADIDYIEISDVSQLRGVERFETIAFADAPSRARRKLKPGDTLLSTVRTYLKAVAFVDESVANSVASTGFAVVRPGQRFNPRFLSWVLQSDIFVNEVVSYSVGVSYPAINAVDVANLIAIQPPLHVQQAIAAHLDRETAKIDTLIAKKRELVAKLKEQRSALISRTVTRGLLPEAAKAAGLDPNPPMKDSGVEWLGEVPGHWGVKKISHLAVVVRGASPRPAGDERYFNGDFMPWITVADVTKDEHTYLTESYSMLTEEGVGFSRKIESDTLILTNSGATLGVPKITKLTGCANDGIVAFPWLSSSISQHFLYTVFTALTGLLREKIRQGSGQPNLNTDIVKAICVAVPPIDEQEAIVAFVKQKIFGIVTCSDAVETAITRLTEYRAALITAAVTRQLAIASAE